MEVPLPFVENIRSGAVFSKSFYLKLNQYSGKVSKPGFYSGLSQAIKLLQTLLGGEGKKGP